jgi:HlyD family secretion protein
MTANLKIEIAKRTNALRIPNTALRFRPNDEVFAALNQTPPPEAQAFANAGRGGRGGRGGFGPGNQTPAAPLAASSANNRSASAPTQSAELRRDGAPDGRAGGQGRGGFGGGRGGPEFQARMMERFKTMSPDEQKQFVARMKERGGDTSAFEKEMSGSAAAKKPSGSPASMNATTIDALFAPLPVVESRGRAWLYIDNQLKPVQLRLGISDGTYTEVLGNELPETAEVVTGVTGLSPARTTPQPQGTGNPFAPGRGGPGRGGRG